MKKSMIVIAVIVVIAGFFTGKYLHNKTNKNIVDEKIISNENLIALREEIGTGEKILVDNSILKITPNTKIIEKIYYTECNHVITTSKKANTEMINLDEDGLKEKYNSYEVQKFTPEEVVLYKEEDDFCHEHYLLKDNNGFIGIYELGKNDKLLNLIEQTDIRTAFLPEEDRKKIEEGIKIYTKIELNKTIEDFE